MLICLTCLYTVYFCAGNAFIHAKWTKVALTWLPLSHQPVILKAESLPEHCPHPHIHHVHWPRLFLDSRRTLHPGNGHHIVTASRNYGAPDCLLYMPKEREGQIIQSICFLKFHTFSFQATKYWFNQSFTDFSRFIANTD